MKLITLNTWAGKIFEPQIDFLKKHSGDTDIFCFQEVYNGYKTARNEGEPVTNLFSIFQTLFSHHKGFHAESGKHLVKSEKFSYGIALFAKKTIELNAYGVEEIFRNDENLDLPEGIKLWNRLLQRVSFYYNKKLFTVFNLHGLYTGGEKDDTPARLRQSEKIADIMQKVEGRKILCGDFNLNPETKSFHKLKDGMRDLVGENKITSTRSHYYDKPRKFADYILVSKSIDVKNFQVLPDVVSDHLPLVLEF